MRSSISSLFTSIKSSLYSSNDSQQICAELAQFHGINIVPEAFISPSGFEITVSDQDKKVGM